MSLAIRDKNDIRSSGYRAIAVIRGGPRDGKYLVVSDQEMPDGHKALALREGMFELIPETRAKTAQHVHIVGPSGCGKTTVCEEFARNSQNKVVVVSADAEDDDSLKSVDMRLQAGPDLCEIEICRLRNAMIIFDDIEGVGKETQKAVHIFQQGLQERGRKFGLKTLNVFHRAADGNNTKSSLSEMTHCVFFPRFSNMNTRYMLKRYVGVPENICELLKEQPLWGRRVLITVNHTPSYIVGDKCAAILDTSLLQAVCKYKQKKQVEKIREAL